MNINHDASTVAMVLYRAIHQPQAGAEAFRAWLTSKRPARGDEDTARYARRQAWVEVERQQDALRRYKDFLAQEREENEWMADVAAKGECASRDEVETLQGFCKATGWTPAGLLLYYRGRVLAKGAPAPADEEILGLATVRQLRAIATGLGVTGVARMSKDNAMAAIKASGADYRRPLVMALYNALSDKIKAKHRCGWREAWDRARVALHEKYPGLGVFSIL